VTKRLLVKMVGINYDEATRGGELRECDGE